MATNMQVKVDNPKLWWVTLYRHPQSLSAFPPLSLAFLSLFLPHVIRQSVYLSSPFPASTTLLNACQLQSFSIDKNPRTWPMADPSSTHLLAALPPILF